MMEPNHNDEEDTENQADGCLNAIRKLQIDSHGFGEQNVGQQQDLLYDGYAENAHWSYTGASFNDILNSNRQNTEVPFNNKLHGTIYDNNNKFSRFNQLALLSEDLRISKILRRLMGETNRKAAVDLVRKLDAAVRNQSNSTYICRSFDILFDNMLTVLRQCPPECLEDASVILGIMGYINRYDFVVYKNNLTKSYSGNKNLRKYLMVALRTTMSCDAVNLDLKPHSERLLSLLKEYLENAEVAENFVAISETIAELSKHYKQAFLRHFTDIVDIIIGWHLETEQPTYLKRHCSKILQQFSEYFLSQLDFTLGLLGQFIEDIDTCGDELLSEESSIKSKRQTECRVGAFIGAFTSIIKAMVSKGVALYNFEASATILQDAKRAVARIAKQCFKVAPLSEETVINLNEFYCIISSYDKSVENLCDLEEIIELQLKHLTTFDDKQVSGFLYMILNIVRQYRTQLPLSFVSLIMDKENECLQALKHCCGSNAYRLLLKTYHEILNIKNVPLLQEAYRHIVKDVNETVSCLKTSQGSLNSVMGYELTLGFYLSALSVMACQTSSIIGMYALNPSILELLISNCQTSNELLWNKYPTLHHALLSVIIEHSSKNHNFRQSSRLLTQHQDSPNSENFGIVLKFLGNLMRWYVSPEILHWFEQLLDECKQDNTILTENIDFLQMCNSIVLFSGKPPRLYSSVLVALIKYPKMPDYILSSVRDIALWALEQSDEQLIAPYCQLLGMLPLRLSLAPDFHTQYLCGKKERTRQLYHWHKSNSSFNTLRPKYFKAFIESLEPSIANDNASLYQTFIEKSFVNLHRENVNEYLEAVRENGCLLNFHLQYETARHCVQQKLRTTLGKPQETFLAIEAIIMKYARFLAEKECMPTNLKNFNSVIGLQKNCRMLLGFMENLEKSILNASDGFAYAMLQTENPAKTFFRVNASTCAEWFKRVRAAVNLIALHSMEPEMVIRYSENILQSDSATNNKVYFDRTITSMAWALLNCAESDTLYGLLAWLKSKDCKGYEWIQYVAEQAAGHLEKAATGYLEILNDAAASKTIDVFLKDFIQKQLAECLYQTARWSEIPHIIQDGPYSQKHLEHMEAIYRSSTNQSYCIGNENLTSALLKMTEWTEVTQANQHKNMETFSYSDIIHALRDSCIARSMCVEPNVEWFEPVVNCIQQGLRDSLIHRCDAVFNNSQLNELVILNHVAQNMQHNQSISLCNGGDDLPTSVLNKALFWHWITGQKSNNHNSALLLNVAAAARLDNNLNYSQSLLEKFFKTKGIECSLTEIAKQLKSKTLCIDSNDSDFMKGVEELMKCLQDQDTSTMDALEVGSACCVQIIEKHSETLPLDSALPSSMLSLLLTMSDSLTATHRTTSLANLQQFQHLQNMLPDIGFCSHNENNKSNVLPSSEYAIGKLLNASILCKQDSGEAWFSFGNWCYRWGKKLIEVIGGEPSSGDTKKIKLTNRNVASIREILADQYDDGVISRIVELLNSHMVIKDDNVEDVYGNSYNTFEFLEKELRNICALSTDQLSAINNIWRQAQKGVYGFYEEATRAYFKYLSIQSDAVLQKSSGPSDVEDCTFVTTNLRLLRLIVKHAIGLQDVLQEGLRNTPLRPWKVIVPQLFSRLNHHEPYVRQSVSDLLCRLAVNQPQLILYPAVVGAQQERKHSEVGDGQIQLSNCFVSLLNSLSSQAPEMVLQIQLLVKELRRITLLWEEYWVHSLAQLYSEYSHLYNALDAESKKLPNSEIVDAKFEIFQHHLLSDFKLIMATTEKEPETNYERNFQERFRPHIEIVLRELQKTKESTKPSEYWQKIKQLYNIFQQRPLRGNSSTIRLSDVSPVLANMRNTSIAMPGVDTYEKEAVYIKAVDNIIFVLPTKTKPKKLTLYGSNGQSYTYLFKGQEDLHLDERIMQFLSISNSMMSRSYGSKSKTDCFKAHHYSVIPLGSQCGLISWVDKCTPLFAIYKKWQQRDVLLKQQKERSSTKQHDQVPQSPAAANTSRPSELFYNKLTPLLAERNIKVSDPRKQWPVTVVKQVLRELSQETPKDLLAKEIWGYSSNSVDWRKSVRRYTMSMAVMSIIGYVIGLGDRHLDNILIKLATGEIVHIDYNVCFEKGKSLRVPEKVPFRMTQNFKNALGLFGVEGAYRLACSHVLKVLRKERETLLTLLEAFVYDPLVDWTVSDDGSTTTSRGTSAHAAAVKITSMGASKDTQQLSPKDTFKIRKQDMDLSRQTLTLKLSEVIPTWLKYKNDVEILLLMVREHVQHVLEIRQNTLCLEEERDNFTKQLAMIRELDALGSARGSHALNTVSHRYMGYKRDLDAYSKMKQRVQQTIHDLDIVLVAYFEIILCTDKINEIEIHNPDNAYFAVNEFEIVKDIRSDMGHHLLSQHQLTSIELYQEKMEDIFMQSQRIAIEWRDWLLFYNQVMRFYPHSQLQHTHLVKYRKAYTALIDSERASMDTGDTFDGTYSDNFKSGKYFQNMEQICSDLQNNVDQSKHLAEERKHQQVFDKVPVLNSIKSFVDLNTPHNRELILTSMLYRIQLAYEAYVSEDNYLLDNPLRFLQSIGQFVNCINATLNYRLNSELLNLLIETLEQLRRFRFAMDDLWASILNIIFTGSSSQLNEKTDGISLGNDIEFYKTYPEFRIKYDKSDDIFKNTIAAFQRLQMELLHVQKNQPDYTIDGNSKFKIDVFMSLDICEQMTSLRTETMISLIADIKSAALGLRANNINMFCHLSVLQKPINDMILQMQTNLIAGLPYAVQSIKFSISESIKMMDIAKEYDLDETNRLCDNLYVIVEQECVTQFDELSVLHHAKLLELQRLMATAHWWLNGLGDIAGISRFVTSKEDFLARFNIYNQQLATLKSSLMENQSILELQRNSIKELLLVEEKRTPRSVGVYDKFVESIAKANQRYTFFYNMLTRLTEYSAVLLRFEIPGHSNGPFEALVKQFNEERHKLMTSENGISMAERNLVQLLDPEDKIDQCWIDNVSALLDEMIFGIQKRICDLEKETTSRENVLQGDGKQLQFLLDSPTRMDLRQLLRIITKSCKQASKIDNVKIFDDIRNVQQTIKGLQNKLIELQIQLLGREFETHPMQLRDKLEELCALCQKSEYCFNDLKEHSAQLDYNESQNGRLESPVRNENNRKEVGAGAGVVNSQLGEQKRNAYAVSVWKRIRMKLEGRDPDANRRSSVAEQVDYVIGEATNEDNLASLYEGWTPWV